MPRLRRSYLRILLRRRLPVRRDGLPAGRWRSGQGRVRLHEALRAERPGDQPTERARTWANEQSIREIYLKPFEMSVKQGGAGAVMSAFNYIGMEWGGSHSGLLNTVLRGEWGFRGMVLTIMKYLKRRKLAAAASAPADAPVKA